MTGAVLGYVGSYACMMITMMTRLSYCEPRLGHGSLPSGHPLRVENLIPTLRLNDQMTRLHAMNTPTNWMSITESQYVWEREALEFVRHRFPSHEPYRAWSNFEFIADDGTINEIDLLICSPQGFFLIEIKSHPGRLFGDAGTWTWEHDGRRSTMDNPVILANAKAKKLRSLLQRQKACRKKGQLPFLEALVFCSAEDVRCDFQGAARFRVGLRDQEGSRTARPGIMAAINRCDCPGLDPMLLLRKRWDLHAERYAAAVTLYGLAAMDGNCVWSTL